MEGTSTDGGAGGSVPAVFHNGGTLTAQWKPGQSGNPNGRPSKRYQLAREVAERAGLGGILALARQYRGRREELAQALLDTACDREAKGQVPAAKLIHDLLGTTVQRAQVQHEHSLNVEVHRVKVREMLDEPEEPREVHLEQPNGNGHDEEEGEPRPPK